MDAREVLALPLEEAKETLEAHGISYRTEVTRPTRDFFSTDSARLYVVRVTEGPEGVCLTLAAKQCPATDTSHKEGR